MVMHTYTENKKKREEDVGRLFFLHKNTFLPLPYVYVVKTCWALTPAYIITTISQFTDFM